MRIVKYGSDEEKYINCNYEYSYININALNNSNNDIEILIKNDEYLQKKEIINHRNEVNFYYNLLLEKIINELSIIHNEIHNRVYWETLIGTWLHFFIRRNLYIYNECLKITEIDQDLILLSYKNDIYLESKDIEEGISKLYFDDIYNRSLYTYYFSKLANVKLIDVLHLKVNNKEVKLDLKNKIYQKLLLVFKKPSKIYYFLAQKAILKFLENVERLSGYNNKIVIRLPYPNTYDRLLIFLKMFLESNFQIIPYMNKKYYVSNYYDKKLREDLTQALTKNSKNKFEYICSELLGKCLPKSYLEDYGYIHSFSEKLSKSIPKIVFGIVPIRTNDDFTFCLASWRERKVKSLNAQHGINYEFYAGVGDNEYNLVDKFYTWGKVYKNSRTEIKPFVAWGLKKTFNYNNNNSLILYATTDYGKYGNEYLYSKFLDYIYETTIFINNIKENIKENLLLRVRETADKDWNFSKKIIFKCGKLNLSNPKESLFVDDLKKCRIFICDNISTCIAEAFVNNVPTIIFLDRNEIKRYAYNESLEIFDILEEAKILFYSPENAALHLNNIFDNVSKWWNSDIVRFARDKFCNDFIRTDENWIEKWIHELIKEAENEKN